MKLKFLISLVVPFLAVFASYLITEDWIEEIGVQFGWFRWVILVGMVFIPCFYSFFVFVTLLFDQNRKCSLDEYPPISILVAVYNEEDSIVDTIKAILKQNYPNKIEILIANDGSTDNTIQVLNEFFKTYNDIIAITLIDNKVNKGKSSVLNNALSRAKYDTIITLDSDTILYTDALINIVCKFLSDNYSAVAGSIRVNNTYKSFMTRIQSYDYLYGISSVKKSQSLFNTTLVAQGAFSCYKKEVLEKYKWCETIGEDIVLSWDMLKDGHKIGYASDAVVFTNAPETYKNFFKQRKRWSIGLVEAFRRNRKLLYRPSFGLPFIWNNLLFIYIDLSYMLFFIPAVIGALFFNYYLLAGVLTLLLIPLGLVLNLVIMFTQYRINKRIGLKNEFNIFGFMVFVLFYQIIQTPACITGYVSEILKLKKNWGTR